MVQRLLDDDLLRTLMAVGQVDIVVGLPTLNNAETIAATVRVASQGLATHFPRARTVIVSADRGSSDGTPEIVRQSDAAAASGARGGLRTQHHISASSGAVQGKTGAMRLVFAVADLLQARAVSVLDPEVTSLTPAWVAALAGSVMKESFDFAAPRYERHPLDVPLLGQFVRPLLRATYGRQIQEPLIGEFGCSGHFAAHCLSKDFWDAGFARDGVELRITGAALAGGFRACETFLGPRTLAPAQHPRPSLREVFPQVVGSLFASLDEQAGQWLPRNGSEPLTVVGPEGHTGANAPALDPAKLGQSFSQDVRDLRPVLESILSPDTFATLWTVAESGHGDDVQYSDELWVATVYDFLVAHHTGVMGRAHIVQALLPLYLGRVASFVGQHAASGPSDVTEGLERLSLRFEQTKPYLVERWNRTT